MASFTRQALARQIARLWDGQAVPAATTEPATMTVRVIDRGTGRGYNGLAIRTVTIPAVCPTCGGPRGEATGHYFCEDGAWYTCDRWQNSCGHIDMYSAVLAEARAIARSAQ